MNWILQTEGIIDHYNQDIHNGNQPIRVLEHMNTYMFANTHSNFVEELTKAIEENGFAKNIDINLGDTKINRTPYLKCDDKSIHLDETFISYLWCVCHTAYTLYIQKIDYPRCNEQRAEEYYKIEQEKIDKANELFGYAKSLIVDFEEWDKENLPNPERYEAKDRDFIEQPNCFFTEAMKFILCHEYTHAIKHADKINKGTYEASHFIEFEREADSNSIELMKKGIFPTKINELAIQIGIVLGILSMFYFRATTNSEKHPNNEDRLVDALEQMELNNDSPCWGIALIGLNLWIEQFDLPYEWNNETDDKSAFYELIEQMKKNTNA
jgi:hypothetical protein